MNNINWDGFRYFIAAAQSGSLSAAAKRLNSNQPTVGRHIDSLESSLGLKLFQRSVKGLTLTQEGQFILQQSHQINESVIKIQRGLCHDNDVLKGKVSLSVPEGLGLQVITPALGNFYRRYPFIKLNLSLSSSTANLSQGEADIAIRLFRPEQANLVVKSLGDMKMGLFASEAYKTRYGLPESLPQLSKHRVIVYGDQLYSLAENQWLLKNTQEALQLLHSDSTAARLGATVAGHGLSIQPELFVKTNRELKPVLQDVILPHHTIWLVYPDELRHSPRIRAVIDFLSDCFK